MSNLPVVEQIAVEIFDRLKDVTHEGGYWATVKEVKRPTRLGDYSPEDGLVLLTQDDPEPNAELSPDGSVWRTAWDQPFDITLFVIPSEKSEVPLDTLKNVFGASVSKALATHETWPTWGNLAIDSRIDAPVSFDSEDGSITGINVRLIVTYRTPYNDPFTAG